MEKQGYQLALHNICLRTEPWPSCRQLTRNETSLFTLDARLVDLVQGFLLSAAELQNIIVSSRRVVCDLPLKERSSAAGSRALKVESGVLS